MDIASSCIFALTLGVYTHTSFPSITGGDAGELLAEACHTGVPHPPGSRANFPLWTLHASFCLLFPVFVFFRYGIAVRQEALTQTSSDPGRLIRNTQTKIPLLSPLPNQATHYLRWS
jgi:hypothetical protein